MKRHRRGVWSVGPHGSLKTWRKGIATYRLGTDGRLTLLGIEPSFGKGPQNLALAVNGQFLLCANMPGKNVAVFRIDAATGGLKAVGEPLAMTSPSCIRVLP